MAVVVSSRKTSGTPTRSSNQDSQRRTNEAIALVGELVEKYGLELIGSYHKGERRAWNARRRAPRVGSRRDGDGYLVLADDGFAQRDLQERVWSKSRI